MLKTALCCIGICCCFFSGLGQRTVALEQFLRTEGLKNAAIGISVCRVSDGETVVEWQPDMALTPASVAKLFPTWFALQQKGKDYRYKTPVCYSGEIEQGILSGDLVVKASGDPTLDSRYFPSSPGLNFIVKAIEQKGIKTIRGKIKVEGAQVGTSIPGSWLWEDVSNYYGARYLPFNYRDNTFILQFQTGAPGTSAKLSGVVPELTGIEIRNEVQAAAIRTDDAWIYGGPYSRVLCVKGSIPSHRTVFQVKGALHDPAAAFVHELTKALAAKGIPVEGKNVRGTAENELCILVSPRLEEIVFHTNKASVNLFAEALGYLSAGEHWPQKVPDLLTGAGITAKGIIVKDACGLSPMNAIPARIITDLLSAIAREENGAFLASLPVAGVDGGLAGYCHASPLLKRNMMAKTGSMSGVRCLAGYLTDREGEKWAFTVLINHYTCTASQLQRAVGRFLEALIR